MTLRSWYSFVRLASYATGGSGMLLILFSKANQQPNETFIAVGFSLMVATACLFVVSYLIYFKLVSNARKKNPHHRRDNP